MVFKLASQALVVLLKTQSGRRVVVVSIPNKDHHPRLTHPPQLEDYQ